MICPDIGYSVKARPPAVCVAIPPVFDFYFTPHRFSGLGPAIVSDILGRCGCQVAVADFPRMRKKGAPLPLPTSLAHLSSFLLPGEIGPISFFTRYQRLGPPIEDAAAYILETSPDVVMIACFAFCYARAALDLAEALRRFRPSLVIVLGGAGVSAHPDYFIRHAAVDLVLAGEAEVSLKALILALCSPRPDFSDIPNLYWKSGGRIVRPRETRHTVSEEMGFAVTRTGETKASVHYATSLSRGCAKACRFCANFLCHGRGFRVIPKETVADAINRLIPPPAGKTVIVNFEDDNLLLDPDYFLAILDLFRAKFGSVTGLRFLAENGMDHTLLTPTLTKRLIDAGMGQFNLSIASLDAAILQEQRRDAAFLRLEAALAVIHQHRLPCITYFICGFKGDTSQSVVSTLGYLAGLHTRIGISLFYPVPGIKGFRDMSRFDLVSPVLGAGASAFPWNHSLTTSQLVTAFRLARLINWMKTRPKGVEEQQLLCRIFKERRLYTVVKNGASRKIVPVPEMDGDMTGMALDLLAPLRFMF